MRFFFWVLGKIAIVFSVCAVSAYAMREEDDSLGSHHSCKTVNVEKRIAVPGDACDGTNNGGLCGAFKGLPDELVEMIWRKLSVKEFVEYGLNAKPVSHDEDVNKKFEKGFESVFDCYFKSSESEDKFSLKNSTPGSAKSLTINDRVVRKFPSVGISNAIYSLWYKLGQVRCLSHTIPECMKDRAVKNSSLHWFFINQMVKEGSLGSEVINVCNVEGAKDQMRPVEMNKLFYGVENKNNGMIYLVDNKSFCCFKNKCKELFWSKRISDNFTVEALIGCYDNNSPIAVTISSEICSKKTGTHRLVAMCKAYGGSQILGRLEYDYEGVLLGRHGGPPEVQRLQLKLKAICYLPDRDCLVTVSTSNRVDVWQLSEGNEGKKFKRVDLTDSDVQQALPAEEVVLASDGTVVRWNRFTAHSDQVMLWKLRFAGEAANGLSYDKITPVQAHHDHRIEHANVIYGKEGTKADKLVTVSQDGEVKIWSTGENAVLLTCFRTEDKKWDEGKFGHSVTFFVETPISRSLVTGSKDALKIWQSADGTNYTLVDTITEYFKEGWAIRTVTENAYGRLLIAVGNKLIIWDQYGLKKQEASGSAEGGEVLAPL